MTRSAWWAWLFLTQPGEPSQELLDGVQAAGRLVLGRDARSELEGMLVGHWLGGEALVARECPEA